MLGKELDVRPRADRRSKRVKLDDGTSVVRKIPNPDAVPHSWVTTWPHRFRPEGFYNRGEPIDCPSY